MATTTRTIYNDTAKSAGLATRMVKFIPKKPGEDTPKRMRIQLGMGDNQNPNSLKTRDDDQEGKRSRESGAPSSSSSGQRQPRDDWNWQWSWQWQGYPNACGDWRNNPYGSRR